MLASVLGDAVIHTEPCRIVCVFTMHPLKGYRSSVAIQRSDSHFVFIKEVSRLEYAILDVPKVSIRLVYCHYCVWC